MLTTEQWTAFGRHVVSYAAGAATMAVGLGGVAVTMHAITADQATQLGTAFQALAEGIKTIVGAVATIASVGAGVWAAYTASKGSQAAALAKDPGTIVVTDPATAKAVPAGNVVSNAEMKVVAK